MKRFSITEEIFLSDVAFQKLEIFNFSQIGELVKKLSLEFRNKYTEIEWKEYAGFRDIINHNYGSIDPSLVRDYIQFDIPKLKNFIEQYLQTHQS